MSGVDDRARLLEETGRRLEEVAGRGDILEISSDSARPDVFLLTFRGKGLAPSLSAGEKFVEGDEWRCELRFPFRYPERPPEVRWRTGIYHPNVPLSGWMSMDDLGMTWSHDAPLDSLCERLWDLVRYAYVDLDQTANFNAREWYASQAPGRFPLDERTLFLAARRKHENVIHYRRVSERTDRGSSRIVESAPQPRDRQEVATPVEPEVTFLGEVESSIRSMPTPAKPARRIPATVEPAPTNAGSAEAAPEQASPNDIVSDPVSPERELHSIGLETGTRVFEIRDTETIEVATERSERPPRASSPSRPALRPLPPPEPDEGIVFLE